MTLKTALLQGTNLLEDGGIGAARLSAEVLLSHALGRERVYLFSHPEHELSKLEWIHYGRYLHERLQGKPPQYIIKKQEFYGREFRVTPDVLIPRPETEHAVEVAIGKGARRVVDVGTGSGAIAVTLALETGAEVWATELSERASKVAAENAERLGARVGIVICDLMTAIASASVDLVVSNPPYVPERDRDGMQREVRDWEPRLALFGGPDGLEVYARIVADAPRVLRRGGWLLMELGFGEHDAVAAMLTGWRDVEIAPDLAGIPRVIAARMRE
jgi:release factor glutamine methyltransferase